MSQNIMKINQRKSAIRENRAAVFATRNIQRGFSLISAIFLLVVIAALGAFSVTLFTTQQKSAAMDVMGSRAYQAARSGIEWAAYHVSTKNPGEKWDGCASTTLAQPDTASSLAATLSPFTVTVNCSAASHVDGAPIWVYHVSAVAQTGGAPGDPGYLERVVSVKMGK